MRFRRPEKLPPYLNRRDQMRMLGMVFALMFVVVAMRFAARPSSWYWLTGRPDQAAKEEGEQGVRYSMDNVDFNVEPPGEPLRPGEFRSPPATPAERDAAGEGGPGAQDPAAADREDAAETTDSTNAHGSTDAEEDAESPQSAGASPKRSADLKTKHRVAVDPEILEPIQDNTIGIRESERATYHYLLSKVHEIPASELKKAAEQHVPYTVLMVDSEKFRGTVVTIEGELKALNSFREGKNPYGLGRLWEAWILTSDSGNRPYRVVCHEVPDGIPQGMQIDQTVPVSVTGYFLKRYGYASQKGMTVTAMLVADRLHWRRPRAVAANDPGLAPFVLGFIALVGTALALTLWRFAVSDRKFQQRHLKRLTEPPSEAIDALDGVETSDVNDLFREMSEDERSRET